MTNSAANRNVATMSSAEVIVRGLSAQGIRNLFCVPGVQNDDFFDALVTKAPEIRPIHTRHEQATAYMALGAAQATGETQAYCVVPGPGLLNTTAALSTAYATCAPILALSGQIPDRYIGKGVGLLHEIPDQLAILKGLTKWAARVTGPADAGEKIREAFTQLRSGAPRPVGLECPMNVWRAKGEVAFDDTRITRMSPAIDTDAIARAAKLLAASKRPLISVGSGAQSASAEVTRLAELLEAPVFAYRAGQGVVDGRHRLSVTQLGAYHLWKETDVVLGIGTRLQAPFDWGTDANLKIIHMDLNPERFGVTGNPDVKIEMDAADGVTALIHALEKLLGKRASRADEVAAVRKIVAEKCAKLAPQRGYVDAIRAALPEDGILVNELTQIGYANHLMWPTYKPRTFLSPGYQGTLGWGYGAALGAKVARPDVPVVSLNGDGGFMFGVQELATAVHHKIGVVAVVFNDGAFGNVKRIQQLNYGGRTVAVDFTNPDFVKLGQSFGVRSVRAEGPAALQREITAAIKADEPALIEAPVSLANFPNPWDLVLGLTKQRGA
jgi:acetolactate synthase I/II/III large subunit